MKKIYTLIVLFFFLASQPVFATGTLSSRISMLDKLDKMDRLDFNNELSLFDKCISTLDTDCAEKHLKKANYYATTPDDSNKLKQLRGLITGVAFLNKSKKCVDFQSFSCAKENLEKAQKIPGNELYMALLEKHEKQYRSAKSLHDNRKQYKGASTDSRKIVIDLSSPDRSRKHRSSDYTTLGALAGAGLVLYGLGKLIGSMPSSSGSSSYSHSASSASAGRSICRNPRLDTMGVGGGYYVECGSSMLGRVINMGSGKWSWWCSSTDFNDSHTFYSPREAMRDLVNSCGLE